MMTCHSKIQSNKECFLCGRTNGLELHHIFNASFRDRSTKYGMVCWLCYEHHRTGKEAVHRNAKRNRDLKQLAQKIFELEHGHAKFMEVFKENYL